jgi:hypothetical protein
VVGKPIGAALGNVNTACISAAAGSSSGLSIALNRASAIERVAGIRRRRAWVEQRGCDRGSSAYFFNSVGHLYLGELRALAGLAAG